jgi:predicted nucleic acid-binding protein
VPIKDILIAATALVQGLTVVTSNTASTSFLQPRLRRAPAAVPVA